MFCIVQKWWRNGSEDWTSAASPTSPRIQLGHECYLWVITAYCVTVIRSEFNFIVSLDILSSWSCAIQYARISFPFRIRPIKIIRNTKSINFYLKICGIYLHFLKCCFQLTSWHPATCANQHTEGTTSHLDLTIKKKILEISLFEWWFFKYWFIDLSPTPNNI